MREAGGNIAFAILQRFPAANPNENLSYAIKKQLIQTNEVKSQEIRLLKSHIAQLEAPEMLKVTGCECTPEVNGIYRRHVNSVDVFGLDPPTAHPNPPLHHRNPNNARNRPRTLSNVSIASASSEHKMQETESKYDIESGGGGYFDREREREREDRERERRHGTSLRSHHSQEDTVPFLAGGANDHRQLSMESGYSMSIGQRSQTAGGRGGGGTAKNDGGFHSRPYYKKCDGTKWILHYHLNTHEWIFDSKGLQVASSSLLFKGRGVKENKTKNCLERCDR